MMRAKFKVDSKIDHHADGTRRFSVLLLPVEGQCDENAVFYNGPDFKGGILLDGVREETAAEFEVGREYCIDFTEALRISPGINVEAQGNNSATPE